MADLDDKIAKLEKSLRASGIHWQDFMNTIGVFQANVCRREFALAESERVRLHTLLDDYIDQYVIAGQLTAEINQGSKSGGK